METTSQAGQDLFAWNLSGKIHLGGFVDLGCHDASFHSNSASLERIGWVGVLCDSADVCLGRKSPFVCCDAANPSPRLLELYSTLPPVLGYLSVDCDDNTCAALKAFPHLKVTCQTITVEHDRYRIGDKMRNEMREFLIGLGYDLVCGDVVAEGYGEFEDWWAHPDWTSRGMRDMIRCTGKSGLSIVS